MNGTNILLVTSNSQFCQEAPQFFARYSYQLTIVKNQNLALKMIQKTDFDVIVCSLKTPSLDGLTLLQQLQAERQTAKIPFILLGNKFNPQKHRQAKEMGADDILFLPYSLIDLQKAIAVSLQKKQALLQDSQQGLEQLRYSITTFLPHEMRTALTGIIAASELLFRKQDTLEPFIIKEMLSCISVSGKRLCHLIHNFLLYSELQSIACDDQKIADLRDDLTSDVKNTIALTVLEQSKKYSRQADLILDLEDASLQIGFISLTKLVTELIDNACKFSPCGTPIKITSKIEDNQFVLAIIDCGRGMTSEQIANINLGIQFDRLIYEQQGFGLGLVISQDLAKLYGGNLLIDSTINQETNVSVTLPIAVTSN
jgi:two-component system, sensor histidine kinase and response regulator